MIFLTKAIHSSVFKPVLQICTRPLKLLYTCFKDLCYDLIMKLHLSELKAVGPGSWVPDLGS